MPDDPLRGGPGACIKKMTFIAILIALVPAVFIGVLAGSVGALISCALLFLLLSSVMPLAVAFSDTYAVRPFQRRFESSPNIVAHVAHIRLRIGAITAERASVQTPATDDRPSRRDVPADGRLRYRARPRASELTALVEARAPAAGVCCASGSDHG